MALGCLRWRFCADLKVDGSTLNMELSVLHGSFGRPFVHRQLKENPEQQEDEGGTDAWGGAGWSGRKEAQQEPRTTVAFSGWST